MLKKLLNLWRHKKVLKTLIKKYEEQFELEIILEQWIIKRVLDGNVSRRKELVEKQSAIKEIKTFINWLKEQK